MKTHLQPGFFDLEIGVAKLSELGGPLVELNVLIDWEAFRPDLSRVHDMARKSNAGAKRKDVMLMFKMLVLHSCTTSPNSLCAASCSITRPKSTSTVKTCRRFATGNGRGMQNQGTKGKHRRNELRVLD